VRFLAAMVGFSTSRGGYFRIGLEKSVRNGRRRFERDLLRTALAGGNLSIRQACNTAPHVSAGGRVLLTGGQCETGSRPGVRATSLGRM